MYTGYHFLDTVHESQTIHSVAGTHYNTKNRDVFLRGDVSYKVTLLNCEFIRTMRIHVELRESDKIKPQCIFFLLFHRAF